MIGHNLVHRRTDGQTDGRTDGRTDGPTNRHQQNNMPPLLRAGGGVQKYMNKLK